MLLHQGLKVAVSWWSLRVRVPSWRLARSWYHGTEVLQALWGLRARTGLVGPLEPSELSGLSGLSGLSELWELWELSELWELLGPSELLVLLVLLGPGAQ